MCSTNCTVYRCTGTGVPLCRFGFSTSETVTIMGAHNLGKARPFNSGFNGPWVNKSDQLGSGGSGCMRGFSWTLPSSTKDTCLHIKGNALLEYWCA